MKLVAWKSGQGQGHDAVIAAKCRRRDFDSLSRLFVAGARLKHNDLHVMLLTSEYCSCC